MDPVPQAPKNVARIRTFKDDLLRAQGNTASTPVPEPVTRPSPSKVTQPRIPATQSPLGKKDYTPLPNPLDTSSPIPQGVRYVSKQAVGGNTSVGTKTATPPSVSYQPKQTPGVTLSKEDLERITHVQKTSILSDEGRMSSDSDLGEGTIVRDKKRKRFKLLPAMAEAISNWFSDTKTEYQKAVTGEVHTVAKAESRLETIRKAIEQGRQAPKDDFSQVAATLKTTERTQIQSAILVKEKSELPEPTWSHVVGDGDVKAEQTAQVEATIPEPVSPQMVEEQIPAVVEMPVEQLQPVYAEEVPREPEVVAPYTTNAQALETPAQREAAQPPQRQYAPARTPSEKPFYIALASIVFVATMLGVGVSYYLFGGANTGVIVKDEATFETPNLFSANTTSNFVLPTDRLTLLSALLANTEVHSEDVAHFYPTLDEAGTPADVESILGVLALRADGSFVRGVREIAFGSAYGEPFVVLTTASFDTAFAGMLGWEEAMSADLAPLFGSPVSSSYNPEVRTDTGTSEAYFKDVIAVNKNARLLVDENGDDRITYTFIDKNTVVITTTREALSEIVPLLK